MPYCDRRKIKAYSENTTIHGLKDLLSTKNNYVRIIWILLFIAAAGLMLEEIHRTVSNFESQPTSTELKIVPLPFLPTVHICVDNGWFDVEKALSRGFTNATMIYLSTLFQDYFEVSLFFNFLTNNFDEELSQLLSNQTGLAEMKKELKKIMEENSVSSVRDMLNLISADDTAYTEINGVPMPNWTGFKIKRTLGESDISGTALCYSYSNAPVNSTLIIKVPSGRENARLIIGEERHGKSLNFDDSHTTIVVRIWEVNKLVLLNKRRAFCNENYTSYTACSKDCDREYERRLCNKTKFPFESNEQDFWSLQGLEDSCSDESNESEEKNRENCYQQCDPCTLWNYDTTIKMPNDLLNKTHQDPKDLEDGSYVIIRVSTIILKMKVTSEYYSYPVTLLLSNVGGLVSLFLGASVLSMVQLFMFWWEDGCGDGKGTVSDCNG